MKKAIVSRKEIVGYAISGVIALFGIVLIILGIVERHMDVVPSKNYLLNAEQKVMVALGVKIGFRNWGLIFLALGVVIAMIILCVAAKTADRENDRQLRRQQRASSAIDISSEVKKAVEIVEEPAPEVSEKPAEEK